MNRVLFVCFTLAACGGSKKVELDLSATAPDMTLGFDDGGGPDIPGPGSTLKCETSGKNAFETYGAGKLVAINEAIFANVTNEITANGSANLGDSFGQVGSGTVPALTDPAGVFKAKLGAFLVWVYGGPSRFQYTDGNVYNGVQDMVTAHTGLAITQAQYDYFVGSIVVPALTANGVAAGDGDSDNDVVSCFAPVLLDPGFASSIVGR